MHSTRSWVAAFLAVVAAAGYLQAGPPTEALTFTGITDYGSSGPYSMGWEFTVATPINVVALGFYDFSGTLKESHAVTLFNWDTKAVVASDTVSNADPFAGTNTTGFRYHAIAPTYLGAGTYYIATNYSQPSDADNDVWIKGTASTETASGITYVQGLYDFGVITPVYPDIDAGQNATGYFGPNFELEVIPETSTCAAMLGLGALGFAAYRRRRKESGTGQV